MRITRISDWSGVKRTLDLDITDEEMQDYNSGELAQRAFPRLNEDEREFILTGMDHEEWEQMIAEFEGSEDATEARDDPW